MRLVLSALILVLIGIQTFSLDASIAMGLSVKNLLIYVTLVTLVARIVVSRQFKVELPGLQACFLFLTAYATVSWLVALFALQYPGYEFLQTAATLKSSMYDKIIFFLVFFYGAQSIDDSLTLTDTLLVGVYVANFVTALDASGVLGLGIIPVRTENIQEMGRVQGAFGEANQHAAVAVLLAPAMAAKAMLARGLRRAFWASGVLFAVAVLFMTASRGAMVGVVLAGIWCVYLFRRFLSLGKVAGWIGVATIVVSLVLIVLSGTYTELLRERVLGVTFSGDASSASSGRTMIWATALSAMMQAPWTLLTGFGWDVYSTMGFEFAPHNTYLGYWFNLGLPGLVAFLLIVVQPIFMARSAAAVASARLRPYLISFVFGFMALAIAIFFVELHAVWLYVLAYVGLTMRLAVNVRAEGEARAPEGAAAASPAPAASAIRFGWRGKANARASSATVRRAPGSVR